MTDTEIQDQDNSKQPEDPTPEDQVEAPQEAPQEVSHEAAANDTEENDQEENDQDKNEPDAELASVSVPSNGLDPQHLRLLEAVLFASSEPLSERLLKNRLPAGANLKALLKHLQKDFANRGVQLVRRGQTWAFRTAPDLTTLLNKEVTMPRKLSRAAIETMAIISYHQPVTRAEIEEIRGVIISRGTIDILLELGWIGPRGRRQVPGRPMTWGTTDAFLDHFGLEGIKDLPGIEELKAAGLLDASPAIQVYRSQAGESGEEQGVLPVAAEDPEDGEAEPLNPEG